MLFSWFCFWIQQFSFIFRWIAANLHLYQKCLGVISNNSYYVCVIFFVPNTFQSIVNTRRTKLHHNIYTNGPKHWQKLRWKSCKHRIQNMLCMHYSKLFVLSPGLYSGLILTAKRGIHVASNYFNSNLRLHKLVCKVFMLSNIIIQFVDFSADGRIRMHYVVHRGKRKKIKT